MVCFFLLSSKRNRKFKHLVQTKPMGENTITHTMKVFVGGTYQKKVRKSLRIIVPEKQQSVVSFIFGCSKRSPDFKTAVYFL